MTPNEYQALALKTMADQAVIHERLYRSGVAVTQMENAARGLTDEVGEINALLKKYIEYGQTLDTTNLIEEAGDVLWRLAQLLDAAGFKLEDAMTANIRKLAKRYPEKYTDALAAEGGRDRGAERKAVESTLSKTQDTVKQGYHEHRAMDLPPVRSPALPSDALNRYFDILGKEAEESTVQRKGLDRNVQRDAPCLSNPDMETELVRRTESLPPELVKGVHPSHAVVGDRCENCATHVSYVAATRECPAGRVE